MMIIRRGLFLMLLAVGYLGFFTDRAAAVDIVMSFKAILSSHPAYDPDGARLTALMNSVATYYEDIFEGVEAEPLNIEFYYASLSSGALAEHSGIEAIEGHPTKSRIRINSDFDWFIDDTPFDNSEFTLKQTFYSDGSPVGGWFNGDMLPFLELAYLGGSSASAPIEAQLYTDMWSVVLHETGHALGMTATCAGNDTADGDYDFDSSLVWGRAMAANCRDNNGVIDPYHLAAGTMMCYSIPPDCRRLPTATDIFSIADAGEWDVDAIDLPRQTFYNPNTTADYNTRGNWLGNQVPDSDTEVLINHGGTVTLSANSSLRCLTVEGISTLSLTDKQLAVSGMTTIGVNATLNQKKGIIDLGTGRLDTGGLSLICKNSEILLGSGTLHSSSDVLVSAETFLRMGSGSTFMIDLDTDNLSTLGSSQVVVNGTAELGDATLVLGLLDGFTPWIDSVIRVFDWTGTRTGTFSNVVAPQGYTFDLGNLYTDGTVTVLTNDWQVPGDANHDGVVDGSDATILAGYWQSTNVTWSTGDFNRDGIVDGSDATILAGYWQVSSPPSAAAVPEPSTLALLLCLAAGGSLLLRM